VLPWWAKCSLKAASASDTSIMKNEHQISKKLWLGMQAGE